MGNICNRLSHAYALTYKVQTYSMQKRLLFKIGYVCKIPWGGGGGYDHLADSLEVDKESNQNSYIYPHWMAAHVRLKNEFTEDEKYHNLIRWIILFWNDELKFNY